MPYVKYPDITVIVGTGRCGTSYLTHVLKQGLDIGFPAEAKFIAPLYSRLNRFGDLNERANLRRLVETIHRDRVFRHLHERVGVPSHEEEILERIQEPTYTSALYATFGLLADKRGHSRLGYKNPLDAVHMTLIAKLLPTSRFIHIIRDGRDVALSFLKFDWGPTNLWSGARLWARKIPIARRDGALLGDRYFEMRLEDLVENTESVAVRLGRFVNCGENPEQVQRFVEMVQETIRPDSIWRWKQEMSNRDRHICEAAAGDVLRACGYPTEYEKPHISPFLSAFWWCSNTVLQARNRAMRTWRGTWKQRALKTPPNN